MEAEPGLRLLLAPQALMGGAAQQLEPGWLTASELARAAAMRQPGRHHEFMVTTRLAHGRCASQLACSQPPRL